MRQQFLQILYRFQVRKMKKNYDFDESELQFEEFLKNMRQMNTLMFENSEESDKANQVSVLAEKNKQISDLQKQCENNQKKLKTISEQLSYFKSKSAELVERNEKYEQTLGNIITRVKNYFKKTHINGRSRVKSVVDQSTGLIDFKKVEELFLQFFGSIAQQYQSTTKQNKLEAQLKLKLEQLNKQLETTKELHLEFTKKYDQTLIQMQAAKRICLDLEKKITVYQEEEGNYQTLIKDLDIKTKNRSQVILLFKGLYKKQRQHKNRCPLYAQQIKLTAKELLDYQEERRKYFAEKKKSLDNVLNFL